MEESRQRHGLEPASRIAFWMTGAAILAFVLVAVVFVATFFLSVLHAGIGLGPMQPLWVEFVWVPLMAAPFVAAAAAAVLAYRLTTKRIPGLLADATLVLGSATGSGLLALAILVNATAGDEMGDPRAVQATVAYAGLLLGLFLSAPSLWLVRRKQSRNLSEARGAH